MKTWCIVMCEENCENSTEREFEDYFRELEPADLIPRLENVLERLDGDEQELAVAGEIVNYVITQLEAMDEDTAGGEEESPQEKPVKERAGDTSPAASELELAAYITGDGTVEGGALELHWPDEIEGRTYQSLPEPLVRPDQLFDRLIEIVEEHRHRAEDAAAAGNEKERYACESVADVIYDAVMEWKLQIKEFTQNGGSE